jgi:hypothetical protein
MAKLLQCMAYLYYEKALMNLQKPKKPAWDSVNVTMFIDINAQKDKVMKIYCDYNNWHKLFQKTINGAKLIKAEPYEQTVEVDHKYAGKVINILSFLSPNEVELEEFKKIYDAIFLNRFEALDGKTRYTIIADVTLKGKYKIAAPFIKSIVRSRIRRYVLEPVKKYAEKNSNILYKFLN